MTKPGPRRRRRRAIDGSPRRQTHTQRHTGHRRRWPSDSLSARWRTVRAPMRWPSKSIRAGIGDDLKWVTPLISKVLRSRTKWLPLTPMGSIVHDADVLCSGFAPSRFLNIFNPNGLMAAITDTIAARMVRECTGGCLGETRNRLKSSRRSTAPMTRSFSRARLKRMRRSLFAPSERRNVGAGWHLRARQRRHPGQRFRSRSGSLPGSYLVNGCQ